MAALTRREAAIARSYPVARVLALAFGTLNLALYFFISRTLPVPAEQLAPAPTYFAFAAAGVAIATSRRPPPRRSRGACARSS